MELDGHAPTLVELVLAENLSRICNLNAPSRRSERIEILELFWAIQVGMTSSLRHFLRLTLTVLKRYRMTCLVNAFKSSSTSVVPTKTRPWAGEAKLKMAKSKKIAQNSRAHCLTPFFELYTIGYISYFSDEREKS